MVQSYQYEWFRIIDLSAIVQQGEYPLLELHHKYGRIVFQLYAGCSGCDFTSHPSGIPGIGYAHFIDAVGTVEEELSSVSLADALCEHKRKEVEKVYTSPKEIEDHLQNIVNVYTHGKVYHSDSNIVNMVGTRVEAATAQSKLHMVGDVNSRDQREHSGDF